MHQLSDDVLVTNLFPLLDNPELLALAHTCRRFNVLLETTCDWARQYLEHFPKDIRSPRYGLEGYVQRTRAFIRIWQPWKSEINWKFDMVEQLLPGERFTHMVTSERSLAVILGGRLRDLNEPLHRIIVQDSGLEETWGYSRPMLKENVLSSMLSDDESVALNVWAESGKITALTRESDEKYALYDCITMPGLPGGIRKYKFPFLDEGRVIKASGPEDNGQGALLVQDLGIVVYEVNRRHQEPPKWSVVMGTSSSIVDLAAYHTYSDKNLIVVYATEAGDVFYLDADRDVTQVSKQTPVRLNGFQDLIGDSKVTKIRLYRGSLSLISSNGHLVTFNQWDMMSIPREPVLIKPDVKILDLQYMDGFYYILTPNGEIYTQRRVQFYTLGPWLELTTPLKEDEELVQWGVMEDYLAAVVVRDPRKMLGHIV